jgi:hypothetical protein
MNRIVFAALALVTVAVSAPAFAATPGDLMHTVWLGR